MEYGEVPRAAVVAVALVGRLAAAAMGEGAWAAVMEERAAVAARTAVRVAAKVAVVKVAVVAAVPTPVACRSGITHRILLDGRASLHRLTERAPCSLSRGARAVLYRVATNAKRSTEMFPSADVGGYRTESYYVGCTPGRHTRVPRLCNSVQLNSVGKFL